VLLPATDLTAAGAVAERLTRLPASEGFDAALGGVLLEGTGATGRDSRSSRAELALRVAAVPVEGEVESVLLDVSRRLKAQHVVERWAEEPEVVQRSTI
jgi:hypothetical protein